MYRSSAALVRDICDRYGTCRLDNHGDQFSNINLTFSGEVSGSTISGMLAVEGHTDTWSGVLNACRAACRAARTSAVMWVNSPMRPR